MSLAKQANHGVRLHPDACSWSRACRQAGLVRVDMPVHRINAGPGPGSLRFSCPSIYVWRVPVRVRVRVPEPEPVPVPGLGELPRVSSPELRCVDSIRSRSLPSSLPLGEPSPNDALKARSVDNNGRTAAAAVVDVVLLRHARFPRLEAACCTVATC